MDSEAGGKGELPRGRQDRSRPAGDRQWPARDPAVRRG